MAKERDGHDGSKRCPVGGEGRHSDHTLNYKGHTYSDHGRRDGCYDRIDSNSNSSPNSYGGNTSSYPTGVSKGGDSGGGHNFGISGGSGGINTHGGSYSNGYDYAPGKHAYNISFKSIMDRTSSPAHGYLVPEKTINLRHNNLNDGQIGSLVSNLQYQRLDLDVFDVSNNKIGFGGVENLFYGLRFDNTLAGRYILTMNFSNNLIGDDGAKYMADSLAWGRFPHLKHLDITGNHISYEGNTKFAKGLQNMKQDIKILINKVLPINSIANGAKKQSDLLFGSKEEKHAIIKDYLKHAQNDGVDIQKVGVSKSIFEKIKNGASLGKDFAIGFIKCNIVPEDTTSFAAGVIVAKISKKATGVMAATDAVACYFEVFDENTASQEGVQFMLDAGIITTTDLLGNVE